MSETGGVGWLVEQPTNPTSATNPPETPSLTRPHTSSTKIGQTRPSGGKTQPTSRPNIPLRFGSAYLVSPPSSHSLTKLDQAPDQASDQPSVTPLHASTTKLSHPQPNRTNRPPNPTHPVSLGLTLPHTSSRFPNQTQPAPAKRDPTQPGIRPSPDVGLSFWPSALLRPFSPPSQTRRGR